LFASKAELALRLDELEGKYDKQFKIVFDAIRYLMRAPDGGPQRDWVSFATGTGEV
jgi:hypothetical protein